MSHLPMVLPPPRLAAAAWRLARAASPASGDLTEQPADADPVQIAASLRLAGGPSAWHATTMPVRACGQARGLSGLTFWKPCGMTGCRRASRAWVGRR